MAHLVLWFVVSSFMTCLDELAVPKTQVVFTFHIKINVFIWYFIELCSIYYVLDRGQQGNQDLQDHQDPRETE